MLMSRCEVSVEKLKLHLMFPSWVAYVKTRLNFKWPCLYHFSKIQKYFEIIMLRCYLVSAYNAVR